MDEIGEMSLRMQAMLLRFLETGEIQRVGADRSLPPLDVRDRGDPSRPRGLVTDRFSEKICSTD